MQKQGQFFTAFSLKIKLYTFGLFKNQADLSLNVNILMISYSYSKLQYIIMSQSLFLMQETHYKFLPKLT